MPDFLRRMRALIALAALMLLTTLTMVSDRRSVEGRSGELPWYQAWVFEVASPIQKLVAAPVDGIRNLWDSYVDLLQVKQENERLTSEVAELRETMLQYSEALVASGHLQRIAAMRDDFEVPMLPATVVGLDVSLWFRSVLVDQGVSGGVRAGNPVITHDGVVGLVTAASSHASRTMLLLDRQSSIGGVIQGNRTRGVVRGNGSGELQFEFPVREGEVMPGDVVITSGLDSVYPKGLRIGEVREVIDPEGNLMQTAILDPAVDFGRLEQVFVMFHRGPTMEILYGDGGADAATAENEPVEAGPAEANIPAEVGAGPASEPPHS